jgi:tRNA(adenine34) deaminase
MGRSPTAFTLTTMTDEQLMRFALNRAREAAQRGEVPVGALVVMDDAIVGEGFNQPIATHDPTAHAEVVALRQAASTARNYRLTGATMYVTIEPCQMCVGAMVHARIGRLVYGAPEPKAVAVESAMRPHEHPALNHRLTVTARVLEDECRDLLQEFFRDRRKEATEP